MRSNSVSQRAIAMIQGAARSFRLPFTSAQRKRLVVAHIELELSKAQRRVEARNEALHRLDGLSELRLNDRGVPDNI